MNKNKLNKGSDDLLRSIFENKILFIIIVIVFSTSSAIFSLKNKEDFIETRSQVVINYPSYSYFVINRQIYDRAMGSVRQDVNLYVNLVEKDYEKFNYKFVSSLLLPSNIIDFLNDKTNARYLEVFNNLNIDIMDYFKKNKLVKLVNPVDPKEKYSTIISLTHPSELYVNNFLTEYINVIKKRTINEFLEVKLNEINKLKKFFEITNQSLNSEIKMLEYSKKVWLDFSFEAIDQIIPGSLKINNDNLVRNILLSLIVSFFVFFLIIFFKQFYKNILNE